MTNNTSAPAVNSHSANAQNAFDAFRTALETAFPDSFATSNAKTAGPEHDPAVRLHATVHIPAFGDFCLEAYRVKRDKDTVQVLDPHGEDTDRLQECLHDLQSIHECAYQTITLGADEYVVFLLPHSD